AFVLFFTGATVLLVVAFVSSITFLASTFTPAFASVEALLPALADPAELVVLVCVETDTPVFTSALFDSLPVVLLAAELAFSALVFTADAVFAFTSETLEAEALTVLWVALVACPVA